jgi:hypothetical protein
VTGRACAAGVLCAALATVGGLAHATRDARAAASAPSVCKPRHGNVLLSWSTENELDILGFDVFRGNLKLNCRMIRAKHPGELRGASYTFKAEDGPGDFRLRIVGRDGSFTWYGEGG